MNINLHIDSIVLDGIDLSPEQVQYLHQIVEYQLKKLLGQQRSGISFSDLGTSASNPGNSINLGRAPDAITLGPQLASAVYARIPRNECGACAIAGGTL